jgi:hypothetical protein
MNDSYNIYGDDEEKEIDGIGKLFFEVWTIACLHSLGLCDRLILIYLLT